MPSAIDDDLFKRLVLYNQYQILTLLDRENSADWNVAADIVQRHWPIDMLPGVEMLQSYARDPFTEEDRTEVHDALDVFDVLQQAEDQGCKVPAGLGGTAFMGYGGNEEGAHLSYFRYLRKEGERWPSLRLANPKDLNSHFPSRELYGRIVAEWRALGSPRHLNQAQFDQILKARIHPENREAI